MVAFKATILSLKSYLFFWLPRRQEIASFPVLGLRLLSYSTVADPAVFKNQD